MSGMWLRRLEVKDLGGIESATIDLTSGVNVLFGPNELGKSSLVRAIRAALLLPTGAAAADELRDWHVPSSPYVRLTVEESPGRIWRIEKRFGGSQDSSSKLEFSKNANDFVQDAKAREVDGKLHDILQWGVPAPGGKGRRAAGLPDSFLVSVLLGDQNDVVGVLKRSLDDDGDESAKGRLTAALQALAEDPRYTRVLADVQEKVDLAFTPTGNRKTARGSIWRQVSEDLRSAERQEAELRAQQVESESASTQVQQLRDALRDTQVESDDARRSVERIQRDVGRKRELVEQTRLRAASEQEVERIKALRRQVEEKTAALSQAMADNEKQRKLTAVRQDDKLVSEQRRDLAQNRVRELETGAAEQQRRLREQEAEKEELRLSAERSSVARIQRSAEEAKAVVTAIEQCRAEIAALQSSLTAKTDLLQMAEDQAGEDAGAFASLHRLQAAARYSAARDKAVAAEAKKRAAQAHRQEADSLHGQAEEISTRIAAAALPAADQIIRLRELETARKVAEAQAPAVMVATLVPQSDATLTVSLDGERDSKSIRAGTSVELPFSNELRATLPGFGELTIRSDSSGVRTDLPAARIAFERVWLPIKTATKCQTLGELELLQEQVSLWRSEGEALSSRASQSRVRGEGLEAAEREVILAEVEAKRCFAQLSSLVAEAEGSEDLNSILERFEHEPRDEPAIQNEIDDLEANMHERDSLRHALSAEVAGDEATLKSLTTTLVERETSRDAKQSELGSSWEVALRKADSDLKDLERQLRDVHDRLATIRKESSGEVGEARAELGAADSAVAQASTALADTLQAQGRAKELVAQLRGELEFQRRAAESEDLDAAERRLTEHRATVAALPQPEDPASTEDQLRSAEEASAGELRKIRALEDELRRAEGALAQVGGDYVKDRLAEATQAVEAARERERALELEFGAWQLLRGVLLEAGKNDAGHLGKALVGPVSARMAELTDGRYGEIAVGPQLDAKGILLGGIERKFDQLSVGTQEQIALLVRLSIAEALKCFLVLDDHLTQTDPRRMAWMRELLEKSSQTTQVIVMTCHPEHYGLTQRKGGTNTVDLESLIKRSVVTHSASGRRPSQTEEATSDLGPQATAPASSRGRAGRKTKRVDEGTDLSEMLRRSLEKKKP